MSACTAAKAVIAMNKSTENFIVLKHDRRVMYEEGAEEHAEIVANKLNGAVAAVEKSQYRKFEKSITVHVCNTVESFTAYCVDHNAAGCVLNERLFLAPKAFQPGNEVLTHELSHLHMEQKLGMITWHSRYPSWFQEGLAVYVSGGQGASKVTPKEARQAITLGSHFTPDANGSLIFRKTAYSYGLKPNMFYRQSSLFVEYLHNLDELKFKALLLYVADGKKFENAFFSAYGASLSEIWEKFVQQLKA